MRPPNNSFWKGLFLPLFILCFSSPDLFAQPTCIESTLTLQTGNWSNEIDFYIYDDEGNEVISLAQALAENSLDLEDNSTYAFELCLAPGCYSVLALDSWGDGWNGGTLSIGYIGYMETIVDFPAGGFMQNSFGILTEGCETNLPGCTDPAAINYNPQATIDDGSCQFWEEIPGCTDPNALNYDWEANVDDGSCEYPEPCDGLSAELYICTFSNGNLVEMSITDSEGNEVISISDLPNAAILYFDLCLDPNECYTINMSNTEATGWYGGYFWINSGNDQLLTGSLDEDLNIEQIYFSVNEGVCEGGGCTDPEALNYDPDALFDNGTCEYPIEGCTDEAAINFEPEAGIDDGSCIYVNCGTEQTYINFLCYANGGVTDMILQANDLEVSMSVVISGYVEAGWDYLTVYAGTDNSGEVLFGPADGFFDNVFIDAGSNEFVYIEVVADGIISCESGSYEPLTIVSFCGQPSEAGGCTDPAADNYDPAALFDDGSCFYVIEGCIDPQANNYDPNANTDDDSCEYDIFGCTDETAVNYNPDATIDDGSCVIMNCGTIETYFSTICYTNGTTTGLVLQANDPEVPMTIVLNGEVESGFDYLSVYAGTDNSGDLLLGPIDGTFSNLPLNSIESEYIYIEIIADGSISCASGSFEPIMITSFCGQTSEAGGCTDPEASNYDPEAEFNDGSCVYDVYGCTDPDALNYNWLANVDDGSCIYPEPCEGVNAELYICTFGYGENVELGITDSEGNELIYVQDLPSNAILTYDLCLDPNECYIITMYNNSGPFGWYNGYFWINANGVQLAYDYLDEGQQTEMIDFSIDGECNGLGCTDPNAMNYDPDAVTDDGSCYYSECNELTESYSLCYGNNSNQGFVVSALYDDSPITLSFASGFLEAGFDFLTVYAGPNSDSPILAGPFDGELTGIIVNGSGYDELFVEINSDGSISCESNAYDPIVLDIYCGTTISQEIPGCTDPAALNYNPDATFDDGSCEFESECESNSILVVVATEIWAGEMSWTLSDSEGNVVFAGNGYQDNSAYTYELCLEDGCYILEMFDSFGDGWNGGLISILSDNDVLLLSDFDTGSYDVLGFGINSEGCEIENPIFGCTDPEAINFDPNATEDDGSCEYIWECQENEIILTIVTGDIDGYVNWGIGYNFNEYFATGSVSIPNQTYTMTACIPDGCYNIYLYQDDPLSEAVYTVTGTYNGNTLFYVSSESEETMEASFSLNSDCDIEGCTDPEAENYDPQATIDDGSCSYPQPCEENAITLVMDTQSFGNEVSWNITDSEGNLIAEGGDYSSFSVYEISLCLADGCYNFNMMDSWGDGWNGAYYMFLGNGQMYAEGSLLYGFGATDIISINSDCEIDGCTDPAAINFNPSATVDDGSCIYGIGVSPDISDLVGTDDGIELEFFPNPFSSSAMVQIQNAKPQDDVILTLFDAIGRVVETRTYQSPTEFQTYEEDFSQLESGVYMLSVRNGEDVRTVRIVKE